MAISKILYIGDCGAGYAGKHLKQALDYGSDIIGLNQKEPNSKGDAEFSPVLILS